MATPGQVITSLPDNSEIIDPGIAQIDTAGQLIWEFDLQEDAAADYLFWLRLPPADGSAGIESIVQTGTPPELNDYTTISLELEVQPLPQLAAIQNELVELASNDKQYRQARNTINKAMSKLSAGDSAGALTWAVETTDELLAIDDLQAEGLRLRLDYVIQELGRAQ